MINSETNNDNLGLTKQRKVVLQVIRNSDEHLTANQIFEKAKQILPSISFATVYNSLRYLKKKKHIVEKNIGNSAARFDRRTSRHDHALCVKCDKLMDMELELSAELVKAAVNYSKFKPESIEVILRGLCTECSK